MRTIWLFRRLKKRNMRLCDYGCGQEAQHQLKNGKWCCSRSHNSCLVKRSKHSEKMRGSNNPRYGKIVLEETRNKIRNSLKGKPSGAKGKKHTEEAIQKIRESHKRENLSVETLRKMSKANKGEKNPNYGKHILHSEETKRKLRLIAIKRRDSLYGKCVPNYNPEGCKLIDEYGKKYGYNFRHAENGREYFIKELGYWVDGYDERQNVVIEVDENSHYDFDGRLKEEDVKRQREIENLLECKFIRVRI